MKVNYLHQNFRTILLCIAMCFVVCSLFSCATIPKPTEQEAANADYGAYPDNYQEIIKNYLADLLFDPYSAVYSNWRGPLRGWSGGGFFQVAYGYRVCVDINAKNRMGGYVGKKLHYFVINNGRIIQYFDETFAPQFCNF